MSQETRIDLYLTPDHECGYFQDRRASSLVVDPQLRPDQDTFTLLTRQGFRRSGSHIYRPHCAECSACHPMRVDVAHFKPNRSQRRCAQRFKDLSVTKVKPEYSEEQFLLFERYIQSRHAGGGMDEDITPESYSRFLVGDVSYSFFAEFRDEGELVGIAVLDTLKDGLSAVYTYFSPDEAYSGLGTYAVLWEIDKARQLRLPWLYLGYWIPDSRKMSYKANFKPNQVLSGAGWE